MSSTNGEAVNVLVIFGNPRAEHAIETLSDYTLKKYRFIYQGTKEQRNYGKITFTNLQEYLEDAKEIITRSNVKLVLGIGELGALVRAALTQEYLYLRGPSVESVFVCANKYYMRCFLDPDPIPFACLDLSKPNLDRACEHVLQKVGIPAFFKPCSSTRSQGVASVTSNQKLACIYQSYISSSLFKSPAVDTKFLNPFIAKHIDERKYPLSTHPIAVIEKHMGEAARINADGYVFNGGVFHWSLSDNLYWKKKPRCCFGTAHPTALSESAQVEVWKLFDAVVTRMVDFGFNNSFVNVEVFVLDSGEVKLMEVNPRRGGSSVLCSREVFKDGDITLAELKLMEGMQPGPPVPNGQHAFQGYFTTCGSGKAKDLFDFSFTYPGILTRLAPNEFVDGSGESGARLGYVCLSGGSREEILEKYMFICHNVLVKPKLSFWEY